MVQKERDFLANPIFLCLLPPRGTVVTLAPLFSNIGVLSYSCLLYTSDAADEHRDV